MSWKKLLVEGKEKEQGKQSYGENDWGFIEHNYCVYLLVCVLFGVMGFQGVCLVCEGVQNSNWKSTGDITPRKLSTAAVLCVDMR